MILRAAAVLALILGLLGTIACGVGIYFTWVWEPRVQSANVQVFAAVDEGLVAVRDAVGRAQVRVKESEIATNEIAAHIRDWGKREVAERSIDRLEIDRRAVKLAGQLQTTDARLESLTEAIRTVRKVQEIGHKFSNPPDTSPLDQLLEILGVARTVIDQAERSVNGIRDFAAGKDDAQDAERRAAAMKILERVLVTILDVDSRLSTVNEKLANLQAEAEKKRAEVSDDIRMVAVVCTLILVWIMAGQVALILCGWRSCCGSSPAE